MTTRIAAAVAVFGISDVGEGDDDEDETAVDLLVEELRIAASQDNNYKEFIRAIENGFKNLEHAGLLAQQCKAICDELTVDKGLVLYGSRIIVPQAKRHEMMKRLHASHQGLTRTRRRANAAIYWPGIGNDIRQVVNGCEQCQRKLPSLPKEPLMTDPLSRYPFEQVSCDLFSIGRQHYLAYVDRLSGYPIVSQWGHDPSANEVIQACRQTFANTGVPRKLRSDNGPQFAAASFKRFLERWGVEWAPSTPYFASSNGLAESNVKILKGLLSKMATPDIKSDEFVDGLIELRNTPRADGRSPCQVVFGHDLRSRVPTHHSAFKPLWKERADEADARRAKLSEKARDYYDRSAMELKPFKVGERVRIQDPTTKLWDRVGDVVGVGRFRDYHVKLPSNRIYWRNRRFLRRYHEAFEEKEDEDQDETSSSKEEASHDDNEEKKDETLTSEPRRSSRLKKKVVRFGINHVKYFSK